MFYFKRNLAKLLKSRQAHLIRFENRSVKRIQPSNEISYESCARVRCQSVLECLIRGRFESLFLQLLSYFLLG